MKILKVLFNARRPSHITDMKASVNKLWCRKGYAGITLFGQILTRTEEDAEMFNVGKRWAAMKNHEMIHLRQAQNTGNSWIRFYILYLWYSFLALRYWRKMKKSAYYLNPFEIEAYTHMYDPQYLEKFDEKGADGWRNFTSMSLSARMRYMRKYSYGI